MIDEDQIDRAIKIGQLIELCGKMGGAKAFDPIVRMANAALHELNDELEPPADPYEEPEVEGVVGDNPPPAARDNIDNDNDGVVDEPDETTTEIDHDDPTLRRP